MVNANSLPIIHVTLAIFMLRRLSILADVSIVAHRPGLVQECARAIPNLLVQRVRTEVVQFKEDLTDDLTLITHNKSASSKLRNQTYRFLSLRHDSQDVSCQLCQGDIHCLELLLVFVYFQWAAVAKVSAPISVRSASSAS